MNIDLATEYLKKADPQMAALIGATAKPMLPSPTTPLEALVDALVSQQLSIKAAATIFGRVKMVLEQSITPKSILNTAPESLRAAGLSGQKVSYLMALAEAFDKSPEAYETLHLMSNDEVVARLSAIKGIGIWTAEMFLMFTLLREDVFPIGDLGIRRAMHFNFFHGEKVADKLLIQRAEIWKPYRTVACLWLWKSGDLPKK